MIVLRTLCHYVISPSEQSLQNPMYKRRICRIIPNDIKNALSQSYSLEAKPARNLFLARENVRAQLGDWCKRILT